MLYKIKARELFVCLFGFLTSSSTTTLYRGRAPRQERLTILRAATHETELGDHDFCLSRSHYTDTDPTCRERAATAGIEPGTSSPGVARSTAELPPPPPPPPKAREMNGFVRHDRMVENIGENEGFRLRRRQVSYTDSEIERDREE